MLWFVQYYLQITIPIRRTKIILPFCVTFFNFSGPCEGVGAAEVEAGAAAEREEGEEGNSCSQCLSQQFVSLLCGKFPLSKGHL